MLAYVGCDYGIRVDICVDYIYQAFRSKLWRNYVPGIFFLDKLVYLGNPFRMFCCRCFLIYPCQRILQFSAYSYFYVYILIYLGKIHVKVYYFRVFAVS